MTDPTADAAKLLPCPFCGEPPVTDNVGENGRALMIECETEHCGVQPHVSCYDRRKAKEWWNTRPQPAPQAQPDAAALASRILATIHNSNKMDHAAVTKVIAEWNTRPQPAPPEGEPDVRLVKQKNPNGCVIASLAMVTGNSYDDILATYPWAQDGCDMETVASDYLYRCGIAWQRIYINQPAPRFENHHRESWPPKPWAQAHLCMVKTSQAHCVVMKGDGTVLDPLTDEPKKLTDYRKVMQVWGLYRLGLAARPKVEDAEPITVPQKVGALSTKLYATVRKLEAAEAKLAEREAELADVRRKLDLQIHIHEIEHAELISARQRQKD